ncbi:M48 family metalloprotease [Kaistia terrae]|uniref:M48 family metalloprotease n=1 Tax=Kaistia terrae TaxID=537017 RepID=A0ABW0PZ53_9HYPH|nr:M48 family metalloprotease [Kaistia terrae]MCX5577313.1 M48 family metalloprotease [Kaistia terrae]
MSIAVERVVRGILGGLVAVTMIGVATLERAQAQSRVALVRDAETEALIQDYLKPIFKAAGLRATSVELYLVNNPSFNAFVASGDKIFVNTGAIIDSKTPNELIGVLAHETGHLAGNHQIQLRQQLETARTMAMIGSVVGMGAAIAGAASGSGDAARAGGGIAMGSGEVVRRGLLAYQRSEEMAADRLALTYLDKSGQSAKGMITTFQRFADNTLFSSQGTNPYLQSHPMPSERIDLIESAARKSKFYNTLDSKELQARHDMVRAKLSAFSEDSMQVIRRYPPSDTSMPARYARAILAYKAGNSRNAIDQVGALIKSRPNFPYFYELQGQVLLESGRAKEAVAPLRKAVAAAPRSGLLRIMLGQALVELGDPKSIDEAVKNLTIGLQTDPDMPIGHRSLARAYALRGDIAMADLATAQGEFAEGKFKEAKSRAKRAQTKFKAGSPAWLRADDILSYTPPSKK